MATKFVRWGRAVDTIADLPVVGNNAGGCNRGDWLGVSTVTAGRATASAVPAPPTQDNHFREVGHTMAARGSAGLVFAMIHFN